MSSAVRLPAPAGPANNKIVAGAAAAEQARVAEAVRASLPAHAQEHAAESAGQLPGDDAAIRRFNLSFKKGIAHLREVVFANGGSGANEHDGTASAGQQEGEEDDVVAHKVAGFMRSMEGLDRAQVGEALGMHQDFYLRVLHHYCRSFDFAGCAFEEAFRQFLQAFRLPGESQKIERVLTEFSKAFVSTAGDARLQNEDAVMVLAYATLMLNVSLHSPKLRERDRMSKSGFVSMLRGCDDGGDLPTDLVDSVFLSISENGIMANDNRSDLWGNLFVAPAKSGWLMKKSSSAAMFKRRWMVLTRERQLFYFEDQASPEPIGFIDLTSTTVAVADNTIVLRPAGGNKYVKSVRFQAKKEPKVGTNTKVTLQLSPGTPLSPAGGAAKACSPERSSVGAETGGTDIKRQLMHWLRSLQGWAPSDVGAEAASVLKQSSFSQF